MLFYNSVVCIQSCMSIHLSRIWVYLKSKELLWWHLELLWGGGSFGDAVVRFIGPLRLWPDSYSVVSKFMFHGRHSYTIHHRCFLITVTTYSVVLANLFGTHNNGFVDLLTILNTHESVGIKYVHRVKLANDLNYLTFFRINQFLISQLNLNSQFQRFDKIYW